MFAGIVQLPCFECYKEDVRAHTHTHTTRTLARTQSRQAAGRAPHIRDEHTLLGDEKTPLSAQFVTLFAIIADLERVQKISGQE